MPTTITTRTLSGPFDEERGSGRKLDRDSSGRLWLAIQGSGRLEFWSSSDQGATWAEATSLRVTIDQSYGPSFALFIDINDNAHLAYAEKDSAGAYYKISYRFCSAITPTSSWGAALQLLSSMTQCGSVEIIAWPSTTSSGWVAMVAYAYELPNLSTSYAGLQPISITSGGTPSATSTFWGAAGSGTYRRNLSIDFNHTGDGKTISGSAPHIYVVHRNNNDLTFTKCTWTGTAYSVGANRIIDSVYHPQNGDMMLDGKFDGSRFLMAQATNAGLVTVKTYERDAADTVTTTRTPPAISDGVIGSLFVAHAGQNSDLHVFAVGQTSLDPKRIKFDRNAGTWGTWSTIEATANPTTYHLAVRRAFSGSALDAAYLTGSASPWNVRFDRLSFNTAPSAPTWASTNGAADVAAALLVDWNFVDPDAGDTQSAYALRRQIGTGAYSYWNAANSTWGATEVKNITSTTAVTLSAGWGNDLDADHKFAVKPWDAADAVGPYGSELVVTPSALVNPTLTAPAAAAVLGTSATTATWTVAQQQAYRLRLYNSTGVTTLWDSGWVTDTVARDRSIDFVLANSTTYQAGIQTRNAEGLASTEARNTFSVSYTAPATPTLTTVAGTPAGAITITITNPTPTGSQPAVSTNELWVRVAAGGSADGERPVGGTGVRIRTGLSNNAAVIDWAAASGRNYQYLVRAIGTNGTTADSAWTG